MVWHHFLPNWVIRFLIKMYHSFSNAPANSNAAANSNDNIFRKLLFTKLIVLRSTIRGNTGSSIRTSGRIIRGTV